MGRRSRADWQREIIRDWEPAEAVRERLREAIAGTGVVVRRYELFRPHVIEDATGDPVHGVLVYCPERAARAIAAATAGDLVADAALRATALELRARYQALPGDLAGYLSATKRRGRRAQGERNAAIIWAVRTIRDRFGNVPTPGKRKPGIPAPISACWIVAAVLTDLGSPTTEDAVRRIWEDRKATRAGLQPD